MAGSGTERVRWGILATGGIAAAFTADLVDLPDAEVVAVASRTDASAKAFAERFGIPRAYGDWASLAADEDVDVVYVATPHSAHRAAAGLCLEAGRARAVREGVHAERPGGGGAGRRWPGERGRFLMEAMWMYCNPLIRRLKALVDDGAIGEVRTVQADFGLAGPVPARAPAARPGAGRRRAARPRGVPGVVRAAAARGAADVVGASGALGRGRRSPDGMRCSLGERRSRLAALLDRRRHPA